MNASAQWQLKGNSPRIYDQYIAPAVSAPWYPLFIKTGLSYMEGPIADIGCGTGSFFFHLLTQKKISNNVKLVGFDLNISMLAIAKEKISETTNNISWVNADVRKIPCADDYFRLLYCQQGIQYFKEKAEALKEIYRIIQPNGLFIATVWSKIDECIGYKHLAEAVLQIVGSSAKISLFSPFSYPDPEVFERLATSTGFKSVCVNVIDSFIHFSSIKDFVLYRIYGSPLIDDLPKQNIENLLIDIISILEISLKKYIKKNGLSFPVKVNYLTGKKIYE
ncbi:MAG: methyltransferase domain-containing protein [Gammaproteobacteria bacterium]